VISIRSTLSIGTRFQYTSPERIIDEGSRHDQRAALPASRPSPPRRHALSRWPANKAVPGAARKMAEGRHLAKHIVGDEARARPRCPCCSRCDARGKVAEAMLGPGGRDGDGFKKRRRLEHQIEVAGGERLAPERFSPRIRPL